MMEPRPCQKAGTDAMIDPVRSLGAAKACVSVGDPSNRGG
jgi:hypothetical protein